MNKLTPVLGVVIVTYNSADVILDCLESLLNATNVQLRIVVVDNASTDETVQKIRDWAAGRLPYSSPENLPFPLCTSRKPIPIQSSDSSGAGIVLTESSVNGGFAAGVNIGLAHLAQISEVDRFWILNPDCVVPAETPGILAGYPEPADGFALMGGRINYMNPSNCIQSDGGKINWLTGATRYINFSKTSKDTPVPDSSDADFISGASMVASRLFYETAGPLSEDYFLYYEEVDWALRRNSLPLIYCPKALVYHHAGTAIGSGTLNTIASPFSYYFLFRARMKFIRQHCPLSLPAAYLVAWAKALQVLLKGYPAQAGALVRAVHGMEPPAAVIDKLAPEAARKVFNKQGVVK